jgi:chromosome segregation ATPase
MEQDTITIEEKVRLENEILTLKREFKTISESLSRAKSDTGDLITLREKIISEIDEAHKKLNEVLLQISNEKLKWVSEKNTEIEQLDEKNKEAEKVLNRIDEVTSILEKIKISEQNATDSLNEARTITLNNERASIDLAVREKQIETTKEELLRQENKLSEDKVAFKLKISNLLSEVNEL